MKNARILPLVLLVLGTFVSRAIVFEARPAGAEETAASTPVRSDRQHALAVTELNLDPDGNIKVHEQGTAAVHVDNVVEAYVTNASNEPVPVQQQGTVDVAISTPSLRAANAFLDFFGAAALVPAGIVVTDMVFSRTSGGPAVCEVQPTFGASGSYLARFSVAPEEVKTIGLTSGLASEIGSQVRFTLATPGCAMYVAWTGYEIR